MATFVLLPGAASDSWYWHLVVPELRAAGHDVIAHSMAAFIAPLIANQVPVELIVLVAGMIPAPGETPGEWWANTGQREAMREYAFSEGRDPDQEFDPFEVFLHDVPPAVAAESASHVRRQPDTPFSQPWPLDSWPAVPTRVLLCRRDRLFPPDFQGRVARDRLGITPDEIDSGHLPALSRPKELAERLLTYLAEARAPQPP